MMSRPGYQANLARLMNKTDEAISYVNAIPRDYGEFVGSVQKLHELLDNTRQAFDNLDNAHQAILDQWDDSQGEDPEAPTLQGVVAE